MVINFLVKSGDYAQVMHKQESGYVLTVSGHLISAIYGCKKSVYWSEGFLNLYKGSNLK
jgi:hypothetical protein